MRSTLKQLIATFVALVCLAATAQVASAVEFEFLDGTQSITRSGADADLGGGRTDVEVSFALESDPPSTGKAAQAVRSARVELPTGLVGDPTSLPVCGLDDVLANENVLTAGRCPRESAVGWGNFKLNYPNGVALPDQRRRVWRVATGPNEAAAFATSIIGLPVRIAAKVSPSGGYRIVATSDNLPQAVVTRAFTMHLWAVPSDHQGPGDDCDGILAFGTYYCADFTAPGSVPTAQGLPLRFGAPLDGVERKPFMTNGSVCDEPLDGSIALTPWGARPSIAEEFEVAPLTNCDQQPFAPTLSVDSKSDDSSQPSGFDVAIDVPQNDDPDALGTAHVKDVSLTLPEGVSISPSSANGLGACTDAEFAVDQNGKPGCPNSSRIGNVTVDTPLLDQPVPGAVFLGEQLSQDPMSGEMFRLFLAMDGPGVLIKLEGAVTADPETGQLTATFTDNPQLPFSSLKVSLKDGSRAPLTTPPSCGSFQAAAEFTSWADHEAGGVSSFEITSGPKGASCVASPAERPFNPKMKSGVQNPVAGSSSPFVFQLTREDGDQEILSTTVTPPEGLTAKLAGIPYCSEQDINHNSCPEASRIGTELAGAGAGSSPFYTTENPGSVYLAGPYKGAPLSMVIQEPVIAGPFDLEDISVRAAIHVDPRTAQLTVISDEIPQVNSGVPLLVRDLRISMDRPDFTIAPTNCDPLEIGAEVQGSHGASATLTNRFQVGECSALGFDPKLNLSFGKSKKDTKPNAHPQLNAKLRFNEADANISSVEVALPQGVFLDQERLGRICSRANYAANTCPEESVVGYAKANTPLLDNPVEGPVYLKASDNVLPDLAADLDGQIDIDLFGMIDQKENKKGLSQIRNTFDIVPDVPVSNFQLRLDGGNDGLLVNSRNICKSKRTQKASIDMTAHNGMSTASKPLINSACKQLNKKKAKKLKQKAKKLQRKAKQANNATKAKQLRKQARKLKKQARKLGR